MAGLSKETQMSIEASSKFPGFRFSPTDVELISYYLKKKIEGDEKCVEVISEVEICLHEPWDLPAKSVIHSKNEWFFFAARGRKYPNGSQSRRATELGYWKATGKERNVKSGSAVIGTKRTLVFHIGRAPKGERTEWIMHEYCMDGKSQESLVVCRLRRNAEFRLNDRGKRTAQNLMADGAAESSRKYCNSSNDSHSIEQLDCASDESEQKQSNELPLPDPFPRLQEDGDHGDDFYADILNDDIVKLDESSTSQLNPFNSQMQPVGSIMPQLQSQPTIPSQGTATRRIKLDLQTMRTIEKYQKEKPPKCVADSLQRKMRKHRLVSVVFVFLILLLLLLLLLLSIKGGSFKHMKGIAMPTCKKHLSTM